MPVLLAAYNNFPNVTQQTLWYVCEDWEPTYIASGGYLPFAWSPPAGKVKAICPRMCCDIGSYPTPRPPPSPSPPYIMTPAEAYERQCCSAGGRRLFEEVEV